jgi:hypothetical protein
MAKRFTDTEIWNKEWYLALSLKHKMLVKFLFDNCDCAGIYEPNFILLSFYIGEKITAEDFNELKQIRKLNNGNYLIEDFLVFQYGVKSYDALNPKFSVHKGILKSLEKNQLLSNSCLTLAQGLQDMDKDMDKDKDNNTNTNKQIETSSKLYGEYLNVYLEDKQYKSLLALCLSEKMLNELINSFSVNIEVGKERPYTADLPNAHFERLKSYYNYRKKNPNKFVSETAKQDVWDRLAEKIGDI